MESLVGTAWLAEELGAPDLRVVDGSWYLPTESRDAGAEHRARHIPGAVYFDIDAIADRSSPLPHMLPGPDQFAKQVGSLGIGNGDRIVAYDGGTVYSAARVWWMFRVFGHENVALLDGGLPKWLSDGHPTEDGIPVPRPVDFTVNLNGALVRGLEDMLANLSSGRAQVLDARAAGRFDGTEPEPRPGMRSGHIPGSSNLPYGRLFDADTGTLLSSETLLERFNASGIDLQRPVVTTCGSGVSAALLAFGLHRLGSRDVAVYDGSWTEWGGRDDTPVEP